MRFFSSLTLLAATASAATVGSRTTTIKRNGLEVRVDAEPKKCLCKSDVDTLVDAYRRMLTSWDDADAIYLADTFYDHSDSINVLIPPNGLDTGFPIFPTKQAFIDHQHTQPDNLPIVIEKTGPWNCDEIALIWTAKWSVAEQITPRTVRGVTILGAHKGESNWQISSIDVEFNNINYLQNIGGTVTRPTPPSQASAAPATSSA